MGDDGVVNCNVADLTGAVPVVGNDGENAFTPVEQQLMQSMALRRTRISFIILGWVVCSVLCRQEVVTRARLMLLLKMKKGWARGRRAGRCGVVGACSRQNSTSGGKQNPPPPKTYFMYSL